MPTQCFTKMGGSNLPVCGVHNVPLEHKQVPDELIASGIKGFTFLVCPASGQVVEDAKQ